MAHVAVAWLGLLPVLCSSSVLVEGSFECRYSSATNTEDCINPKVNGYCRKKEECLTRKNETDQHMYAACCCDNETTPVHQIIHDRFPNGTGRWSVWITHDDHPGGQSGAGRCKITYCARPWTAQRCFGGEALCCPANTRCGVSLSTGRSCYGPNPPAPPSRASSEDCCIKNIGLSCAWGRAWSPGWPWFWFWFPLPGFRSCCLELEENCKGSCRNSQVLLGLSVSTILVVCGLLHKSRGRRGTRVSVLLVFAFLQFLLALANEEGWLEAAIWVGCSSVVLLLCRLLATCCCPTQKRWRPPPTLSAPSGSRPSRYIAVILAIEHYSNSAWDDVEDKSIAGLQRTLQAMGYTVMPFRDPAHGRFEGIVKSICSLIEGTTDSKVIIYMSCHARMIYGKRWIIPSDAGAGLFAWHQWISVDNFLRDLDENEATNPHFITLVNGCGTRSDRCDQMWWRLCHGSEDEVYTDLDEVNVNIFYACGPGGIAFEDNLTAAFVKALQANPNRDLSEIFRVMRDELRPEDGAPRAGSAGSRRVRVRQRLWFTTSDQPISLEVPGRNVSFQSATSSSSLA